MSVSATSTYSTVYGKHTVQKLQLASWSCHLWLLYYLADRPARVTFENVVLQPESTFTLHYLLLIRNNVKSKLVLFLIFSQILTSAVHYLCLIFSPKKGSLFLKKYGKRWYVLITLSKNTKLYLIFIYRRTVFIPFHFFTNF